MNGKRKWISFGYLALLIAVNAYPAKALEFGCGEIQEVCDFSLSAHQTYRNLELGSWKTVRRVEFSARSTGRFNTGFEVLLDGMVIGSGSVNTLGHRQSFSFSTSTTSHTLGFRRTYGDSVKIEDIKVAYESEREDPRPYPMPENPCEMENDCRVSWPLPLPLSSRNDASRFAKRAIELSDILEHAASHSEYGEYLLPIKKTGALAFSTCNARGPGSRICKDKLVTLGQQIKTAREYLEGSFERDIAFRAATELWGMPEAIGDWLDVEI